MIITPKAKGFFFNETRDLYSIPNFDEVYFIMQHLIEFDLNESGIAGLSDRLPYAINHIVEGKLTRDDVLTFFPIVWQKYESYVKKILFIVDPEGYSTLAPDPNKTLPNYLDRLKIPHLRGSHASKAYTWAFYRAKELRNTESHDCENWSIHKCYDELSQSMLAYLLTTDHCLNAIKRQIRTGMYPKLPAYPASQFTVKQPGFIDLFRWIKQFPGVDFSGIKIIKSRGSNFFFDQNGNLEKIVNGSSDGKNKYISTTLYKWERHSANSQYQIVTRDLDTDFPHYSEEEKHESELRYICEFDEVGQVIKYTCYRNRGANNPVPREEYNLSYLEDGGIEIVKSEIREEIILGSKEIKHVPQIIYRLNSKGLITVIGRPYRSTVKAEYAHVYDENGVLTKIEEINYGYKSVETISNQVFFRFHDNYTEEEYMTDNYILQNGRLIKAISYRIDQRTNKENQETTEFEYYTN